MFSILWRFLPGPAWLRLIVLLAVLAGLVYAAIFYIYPWVQTMMPAPESEVGSGG
ncbi:MAG: hypothetical protein Q4C71_00245 [Microbacteriaceae bacterium]|nr:hypothetical protein [Microbacteriaceae bacterium]